MDLFLKKFATYFVKPFLIYYLRKTRSYVYNGLNLTISPGVFHPGFFFSSKMLADFVGSLELKGKSFCEPCTGSGLIALSALRKGAMVTAFDINPQAVKDALQNFEQNKTLFIIPSFKVYQSDLFDQVPLQTFDYVVVNPPYFFGNAKDDAGKAWYAGAEGEYFRKFFRQLKDYTNSKSKTYMVLGDNCDLERIKEIAASCQFTLSVVATKKIWWERNFIFEINSETL